MRLAIEDKIDVVKVVDAPRAHVVSDVNARDMSTEMESWKTLRHIISYNTVTR